MAGGGGGVVTCIVCKHAGKWGCHSIAVVISGCSSSSAVSGSRWLVPSASQPQAALFGAPIPQLLQTMQLCHSMHWHAPCTQCKQPYMASKRCDHALCAAHSALLLRNQVIAWSTTLPTWLRSRSALCAPHRACCTPVSCSVPSPLSWQQPSVACVCKIKNVVPGCMEGCVCVVSCARLWVMARLPVCGTVKIKGHAVNSSILCC